MTVSEAMPTHILYDQFRSLILEKTGLFFPDEKRADLARKARYSSWSFRGVEHRILSTCFVE
jgi:hypothetical protein